MTKLVSTISNIILLAFVAYGPWHDAPFKGFRVLVGNLGPFANITTSGIFNFAWITVISASLLIVLLPSFRKHLPSRLEWAVIAWPLYVLLHIRQIDSHAFIASENAVFLGLLILLVLRKDDVSERFELFSKYALKIYLGSYASAVLLPKFIFFSDANLMKVNQIARFTGWVGEGTALSLCGWSLIAYGCFTIINRKKFLHIPAIAAMAVGMYGIQLNVHRMSLLAVSILFLSLIYFAYKVRLRSIYFPLIIAVCATAVIFLTGRFATKSNFWWSEKDKKLTIVETDPGAKIDKYITTNGRIGAFKFLYKYAEGKTVFGLGTGSVPRLLKNSNHFYEPGSLAPQISLQPQNDYLRVFIEHGFVGLILFLSLAVALVLVFRGSPFLGVVLGFGVSMLTENMLVFPTIGYGPLLLSVLVLKDGTRKIS